MKDIYWTIGPHDIVAVMEAPDDETVTAAALKVSGLGNVRTTTLRALSQPESALIVARPGLRRPGRPAPGSRPASAGCGQTLRGASASPACAR